MTSSLLLLWTGACTSLSRSNHDELMLAAYGHRGNGAWGSPGVGPGSGPTLSQLASNLSDAFSHMALGDPAPASTRRSC